MPGKREHEVEHRERAHEQDDVDEQREVGDEAGESVVDQHADQRDRQTDQTGDDAGANRIRAERRRDAAFLFDADRRLQRILQHAGQTARFLFAKLPGDDARRRRKSASRITGAD